MKTILYLGTDPTQFESRGHNQGHLIHYPVIRVVPRPSDHPEVRSAWEDLEDYTHLLFTSKNAVKVFFGHLSQMNMPVSSLHNRTVIAIGAVTAMHLAAGGLPATHISQEETQEGVVRLLQSLNLTDAYLFMPRSSLSRPVLSNYFGEMQIRYQACDLYDTVSQVPALRPNLDEIDEIVFTSPSTVRAFFDIFKVMPKGKKCLAIGPVTAHALKEALNAP